MIIKKIIIIFFLLSLLFFSVLVNATTINPDTSNISDLPFDEMNSSGILNPVIDKNDVIDVPSCTLVADPFIFYESGVYYIFFEAYNNTQKQGVISYAISNDGLSWIYQQVVNDPSYHLSFPTVFKVDSDYYMMTQSGNSSYETLFKATSFPTTWAVESVFDFVATPTTFADNTLFFYNNYWWWFASTQDQLCVYYNTDFTDNTSWVAHPNNPLKTTDDRCRMGGRLHNINDRLFRVNQDKRMTKRNIEIYEITTLSTTEYVESRYPAKTMKYDPLWSYDDNVHQYDICYDGNRWVGVVDGRNGGNEYSIGVFISDNSDGIDADNFDYILSGNENYTFASGMVLDTLWVNETWVRMNDIYFNITSSNTINLSVSYLNNNIINQVAGTTILTFNADTTGAAPVWFNLSGFKVNHSYGVYRDNAKIQGLTSNLDGNLSFSNTVWSDHEFDVVDEGNTIRVTYARSATADTVDTSYTVLNLVGIIGLAVVAAVILLYVVGMGRNKGGV